MALEIRLTPAARRDLVSIHDWSAQNFGDAQADRYVGELYLALRRVCNNPDIARDASKVRPGLKSWPVGSHVAYFRIGDESLTIIRILHGRIQPRKWLG